MSSPVGDAPLQGLTSQAGNVVVWVTVGLVFLWLLSAMAETVLARFKPVLVFLVAAAFVGVIVANLIAKL